jgi:amino acid transporter
MCVQAEGAGLTSMSRRPPGRSVGKMRLLSLIAATYFMVSGGPYGIEDILGNAGYGKALLLLIFVPLVWSLPTSLMVGELASALPREGGYYWWVRRALGGFWGFQEAWLSLAASIFDMALYPTLSVLYLARLAPNWTAGYRGTLWALAIMVLCAVWNLRGAKSVGDGSIGMFCLLISPFAVLVLLGLWKGLFGHAAGGGLMALSRPVAAPALSGAVLVCLWNYMGWDNASTVAQEVENPQRNYPLAMLTATGLVVLTYIFPLAAVAVAGMRADALSTGAWTDAARWIGGPGIVGTGLALAVVLGGVMTGIGMFNALVMSYSRVPAALAEEGLLPSVMRNKTRANVPWVSVVCCCAAWALALRLSFERLISIDLVLYGAALLLEFVALVVLRFKEPDLARPFRVPGGKAGTVAVGVGPALLIGYALWAARNEHVGSMSALEFAALVGLAGVAVYAVANTAKRLVREKARIKG